MSDKRQLKTIATRYDLDVSRHRDPWRMLRFRLSVVFAVGSLAACLPWLLGDHRAFQSHCVSDAHRVFEQNCQTCHDRSGVPLLRMVSFDNTIHSTSDRKCRVCHRETSDDHLSPPMSGDLLLSKRSDDAGSQRSDEAGGTRSGRYESLVQQLRPQFSELGCAGCHQEHRGHSKLADVADAHCSKCHTTAHQTIAARRFELDFSDFSHHPEFALWRSRDSAKAVAANESAEPELVRWERDGPVDQSAIKFSHHRHLDPRLPMPGGKTMSLNCADCHQSDPGGAYFRPMTFAQDCQRCHKLGFPSTGELPHSKPEIIRGILLERLANHAAAKQQLPAAADEIGGPTKGPLRPIKTEGELPPGLAVLAGDLKRLEQQLFATPQADTADQLPRVAGLLEAACTKCHFTERTDGAGVIWKVIPPRLPTQWMGHSRFRHDRHASVDCQLCHTRNGDRFETVAHDRFYPVLTDEMKKSPSIHASTSAQDVLMPRIEICHQCHGHGNAAGGRRAVGANCVDCHSYHHTPLTTGSRPGIGELLQSDQRGSRAAQPAEPAAETGP